MVLLPLMLLGADDPPPDDAISNRILDATFDLTAASGVQHLTMNAVARRARVGRMTVYRRFKGKQALVRALAAREARRCIAEIDAASSPEAPIAEQVAAGFATSLRLTREHPLMSRLIKLEPETVLAALTKDGGALFGVARTYVAERLRESQQAGMLGEIEVDEAAELLVRMGVSFVLIPESVLPIENEERVRGLARRLLAPILEG